jgi:hypothetical protein
MPIIIHAALASDIRLLKWRTRPASEQGHLRGAGFAGGVGAFAAMAASCVALSAEPADEPSQYVTTALA